LLFAAFFTIFFAMHSPPFTCQLEPLPAPQCRRLTPVAELREGERDMMGHTAIILRLVAADNTAALLAPTELPFPLARDGQRGEFIVDRAAPTHLPHPPSLRPVTLGLPIPQLNHHAQFQRFGDAA
jgi:hypothetical protein